MRILVLGAGAIGGYFGGRLAEAGADVTFLVRPKRREQIARKGLMVESPLGNVRLKVKTVAAEELGPGYDIVLFTCKAYDLDSAMDAIAPAMVAKRREGSDNPGQCAVLPMLNGIAHFERLDERFGKPNVLGGTCQINVTLRHDGVIVHGDPLQAMIFGERDRVPGIPDGASRPRTPRVQAFADAVAKSKIDAKLSDDIELDLWEKITFLSALAATTCLFRGNVSEIIAAPGGRETMERALKANIAVATAEGHAPRAAFIERVTPRLVDPAGTWSASMLRDLEGGGQVEADHIVGWMLGRARRHGIDDTVLAMAYTHLKAYENRRRAKRLPQAEPRPD